MHAVTFFDGEGWREGVIAVVDGRTLLRDEPPAPDLPRLDGVVVGGFTDHHVHLQLVDPSLLTGSLLGRVVDLGGNPAVLARLAVHNSSRTTPEGGPGADSEPAAEILEELRTPPPERRVAIDFAGAFLTPPGGYPSDRSWAPPGSVREVTDAAAATAAVGEMADAGATCIKIASNSTSGPVFGDELFRAVVTAATAHGLSVVAHAEGPGEAQRATRLGARTLAHTPFTEHLTDAEIVEQADAVSWISTLSIHGADDRDRAIDNLRRFHAAGGTVLYGTDMGNGPTPVDLHPGEVAGLREAGIDGHALLLTLRPVDPLDPASVLLLLPGTTADPLLARPLTPADLKV